MEFYLSQVFRFHVMKPRVDHKDGIVSQILLVVVLVRNATRVILVLMVLAEEV